MIIVDDCSSDNTVEIVQEISIKDPRVRILKQNTNDGAAKARNRSLNEAKLSVLFIFGWAKMHYIFGINGNKRNKYL